MGISTTQALDAIKAAAEQLGNEPTAFWLRVAEVLTHAGMDVQPMYLPGALTHEAFPGLKEEWQHTEAPPVERLQLTPQGISNCWP